MGNSSRDPVSRSSAAAAAHQRSRRFSATPLSAQHRQRRAWLVALSTLLLIGLSGGAIAGSGWVAIQLLLSPYSLPFVNRWLPQKHLLAMRGVPAPQTLGEIQQQLKAIDQFAGGAIALGQNWSFLDGHTRVSEMLLPIQRQRLNCWENCTEIVELRLYQAAAKSTQAEPTRFYQVSQLAIAPTEESFIVTALTDLTTDGHGASRSLPLSSLTRFDDGAPPGGVWFNLSGTTNYQTMTIAYGRILHYNPRRYHLSPLLEWASPNQALPTWEKVSASATPELVINQTTGIEPHYKAYRVVPTRFMPNSVQLQPILLLEPALKQRGYDTALLLARSGLWSSSLHWMEILKRRRQGRSGNSNDLAQAQLRLIAKHAAIARNQAEQNWASSSQQVLANLLDGRWQSALQILETNPNAPAEVAELLRADSGRLQSRIQIALRLDPNNRPARAWNTLLIATQQGKEVAIAWLKKQPKITPAEIDYISSFLLQI